MKSGKLFTFLLVALVAVLAAVPMAAADNGKSPGDQTIVEIASGNPEFETLVNLVVFAGLDGALSGEGQFTVFAPTNAAFESLIAALNDEYGEQATNDMLSDPAFVTDVLLYHVTDGRRFSNSVFNQNNSKSIEMLNGDYIWANPDLTVTDGSDLTADASIVSPLFDISASNGVIHVIDAVLVP